MSIGSEQITKEIGRRLLIEALQEELLGPENGPDEIIEQRPSLRYLLGRLAPAGTPVGQAEDEGLGDGGGDSSDDGDSGPDGPISMALNPSSIGVSFVIKESASPIAVTFSWGEYFLHDAAENLDANVSDVGAEENEGLEPGAKSKPKRDKYKRVERTVGPSNLAIEKNAVRVEKIICNDGAETLVDRWVISRPLPNGRIAVSVFMVNSRPASVEGELPDDSTWIFQPKIHVSSLDGSGVFCAREFDGVGISQDEEVNSQELLYWDRPEFAVGHGCAADWEVTTDVRLARNVSTDLLPKWELPRIDPRQDVEAELRMSVIGGDGSDGLSGADLLEKLSPLADAYEEWINKVLKARLNDVQFPNELRETAQNHVDKCEESLRRVREGIEVVSNGSDEVRKAFCFANRAMSLQRERSLIALSKRRGESKPTIDPPRWRPFQIAFILISIPSLINREHEYRDSVDLLWFPTGGGKTEAYLGLTAFTLAHRRLREPVDGFRNDAGVTVLMRYTLRLLTIQQFQRATSLICACEYLRVQEEIWGEHRFSIGLWVGRSATPNIFSNEWAGSLGAKQILEKLNQREIGENPVKGKGTPLQLLACPWCGCEVTSNRHQQDYVADEVREVVFAYCSSDECFFGRVTGDGIPVHTVDQQVYRQVPSLVISTVDKFAQMPFNGRVQALFGKVKSYCPRHGFLTEGEGSTHTSARHNATGAAPKATVIETLPLEPPDLVIQDELHLISGPLGTMVGAYETAVDYLSSVRVGGKLIGPKVIASTATIRRADRQVGALFNKRVEVFPPLGLQASDSWFGQEVPTSTSPGRMYLGVFAPGKSVKTALVRVYAALLSRAKTVHELDPKCGDPYMTMVGYYNSLRELGGAIRLLEDDVPSRIAVLSKRDRAKWPRRYINNWDQLTSTKTAEEVPEILRRLEFEFGAEKPEEGKWPLDVLLASNMISVGVDIDRLGLMVVTGQPKTTSEYIQATSRVGRQSPGLVVCVYNWSRPRDASHFERFRSYHGALYRFVEATSVTPFSSRARDKSLQGVISSMIRLGDFKMTPEKNADQLDRHGEQVIEVIDQIERRAGSVAIYSGENAQSVRLAASNESRCNLDSWEASFAHGEQVCWTEKGLGNQNRGEAPDPNKHFLVQTQEESESGQVGVFVAPGSLREVETEIHVFLVNSNTGQNPAGGSNE